MPAEHDDLVLAHHLIKETNEEYEINAGHRCCRGGGRDRRRRSRQRRVVLELDDDNRGRDPSDFNGPAHGTAAHENAEKTVTGTNAAKAQAAAVKAVGSGTAGAVTSDFTGSG